MTAMDKQPAIRCSDVDRGRALLAGRLLGTIPPAGCPCRSCAGDPFDPAEVATILDHLGDQDATQYGRGLAYLDAITTCAACAGPMPIIKQHKEVPR